MLAVVYFLMFSKAGLNYKQLRGYFFIPALCDPINPHSAEF